MSCDAPLRRCWLQPAARPARALTPPLPLPTSGLVLAPMTPRGTFTLQPGVRMYYAETGLWGSEGDHWEWHRLTNATSPEVGAVGAVSWGPGCCAPLGS